MQLLLHPRRIRPSPPNINHNANSVSDATRLHFLAPHFNTSACAILLRPHSDSAHGAPK
jgi:hypothetical protein